ncbi:aldehyde dehydrogenase family protein [Streptomyces caeruleatus]|uniref:Aldehyde dehydrogenase n=1 Tax=Streptomyces caeruleatus TaxID=661399 RepID=A0A101U2L9_9ACTN|nr:aldehyde dehydrogenase family protein [Streptomyces caeruleatus]KUO03205.1 aldehyde dehydrogenase [Streptomyces caeruleatus]
MSATSHLVRLDALGPSGAYRSRNVQTVNDIHGAPYAELSLVPPLFVARTMAALRKADPLPLEQRLDAIAAAGRAFATGTVGGLSAEEYQHAVCRVSGLPWVTTEMALEFTAQYTERAYLSSQLARPAGAVNDWRDPRTRHGSGVWARRGHVFAVHAPGNTPSAHTLWLQSLALGYRVALRPSSREPFSPHRWITALRDAGFGPDQVALLPTDHATADEVVRGADLAMVYGDDEVVRKYASSATVLPQGPGRSKFLLTKDADWTSYLDTVVSSVSAHGGAACINTTTVYVEGDPAPLARALAERLAALPSLPPQDPKAVLPVKPLAEARGIERFLLAKAAGTTPWLGGDGIVDDLGDGTAVLRPAVHQVARPDAPQTRIEQRFPCVWVAPWSPEAGVAPLRDTVVLTAVTDDEALVDRLFAEPSIANVYLGDHPTYWLPPGIPHDDYLESFLMRTKACIR